MRSLAFLQRHLCVGTRNLAERHLGHARHLLSSHEPADIYSALSLLDAALKLLPQWEKALELKARALLCLRRFKDVANLLYDSIPSLKEQKSTILQEVSSSEKVKLLVSNSSCTAAVTGGDLRYKKRGGLSQCLPLFKMRRKGKQLNHMTKSKCERDQWRYLVLGQACCHLGMMEDAKILLMNSKQAASAALRKQSNRLHDDGFCVNEVLGVDLDVLNHLLGNIKVLLRRRTAAMAAFEAGLYAESVRHFTKILDGRKGTPQGFIADCYLHRAKAYQADGRVTDAIADCNKTLILNPMCAEAFSMRASLYEMVGCLFESVHDLEKLKSLYHSLLQNQELFEPRWVSSQNAAREMDFQGCVDFINEKLTSMREKLVQYGGNVNMIEHHIVLGVSRGCSRAELERAYVLLCLKHRPDKATSFVDRCEFVDERDIEFVKEEARSLALRLFRLIQKAYAGVLSTVSDQDQVHSVDISSFVSSCSDDYHEQEYGLGTREDQDMHEDRLQLDDKVYKENQIVGDFHHIGDGLNQPEIGKHCLTGIIHVQQQHGKSPLDEAGVLPFVCVGVPLVTEDSKNLINNGSLSPIGSCGKRVTDAGPIKCTSLPPEMWMNADEWNHQTCSPPLLSL